MISGPPFDRRTPGQRAGLTAEIVVAEAKRLMTDDGLDRVTMRALSARLGVAPNAVYSYFRDKSALLDGLLDGVIGEVHASGLDSIGWREGLLELMGRSRRVLLEHADLLPQLLSRPTRGPNAIRLGEATLELLSRAGVHGEQAVEALRILLVYTFGFVALEAPRRADPEPEMRSAASAAAFRAAARSSRMAELAQTLASPSTEKTLETGLNWLLDGIVAAR